MSYLDPVAVAETVNQNAEWASAILSHWDHAVISEILERNRDWMVDLLRVLDPAVFAGVFNEYPEFTLGMMKHLDQALLVDIIERGAEQGAFDGVVLVVDVDIPGLGSFEGCKVRMKGARYEGEGA
jgi:hypothetical protein